MSDKILNLQDSIETKGSIIGDEGVLDASMEKAVFRTRIQGFNELGELLFTTQNNTVIGGALFTLEKLFGVNAGLTVDTLNNIMGVGTTGAAVSMPYPKETVVCLFGVGTGGAGESITSVKPVDFKERTIMDMIPFRYTEVPLSTVDQQRYWFRKTDPNGKVGYYLKNFESAPITRSLWKDAEGDEDGTEVQAGVHTSTRTEGIETFVEITLKISKQDCREFFEFNGNIEQARINSIGLFTGIKSTLADGKAEYKQVKLFSKLNINNEMLTLAKDLTIVYRIYTS